MTRKEKATEVVKDWGTYRSAAKAGLQRFIAEQNTQRNRSAPYDSLVCAIGRPLLDGAVTEFVATALDNERLSAAGVTILPKGFSIKRAALQRIQADSSTGGIMSAASNELSYIEALGVESMRQVLGGFTVNRVAVRTSSAAGAEGSTHLWVGLKGRDTDTVTEEQALLERAVGRDRLSISARQDSFIFRIGELSEVPSASLKEDFRAALLGQQVSVGPVSLLEQA